MKNILYPNIISLSDSHRNLCWHPARQRVTVQRRIGFCVGGPSSKVPGPRRPKKKVSRGKCACIELDGEIQVKISDSSDSMLHGFIEKNNHVLKCSTTFHVCCFGVKRERWHIFHGVLPITIIAHSSLICNDTFVKTLPGKTTLCNTITNLFMYN